ncbi:hypothetical protein PR003_g3036 [Phytophthora rubi]|uniref:Uncharacterized protein n=1 Tax=Phytophthora rubi TaxID=129364 RepID=A0A6A4G1Z3_9STRA|nr:hypothetical protein PR003_g3036 [Phytophthora rubi]
MLGGLVGQNVAQELLLPASERGVSPPNLGDIQVRMHVERETAPLLQCFGADDFAIRVLGTLKHLHVLLGQVSQLQTGASSFDSLVEAARLIAKVGELTALIDKQRSNFQAEIQGLQAQIARSIAQPRPDPSDSDVNQLMDDIQRLTRKLDSFGTTRSDAVAQREHLENELQSSKRLVEDLQAKVANSAVISPSGLIDFIMEHCRFEGHWPRLQQILECYWSRTNMPSDTRTRAVLQARDLDDDNCDPYVPSVQRKSADCAPLSSGQAAQALSRLAQATTSSPVPSSDPHSGRSSVARKLTRDSKKSKTRQASLPGPSRPTGRRSTPQESDSSETRQELVDLTASDSSGSRRLVLKSQVERSARQLLPHRHIPMSVKPLDKSSSAVTELDAAYALLVAVETVGKAQVLHDKFSLLALIRMLGSAIYWEALDSTPWMRYVPLNYFKAAFDRIKEALLTRPPEHWDPLPTRSSANDDDFMDYDPKDFEDADPDDDDDEAYPKPAPKRRRLLTAQASPLSSGSKRSRKSSTSSRGPGVKKKTRRDSQSPGQGAERSPKFALKPMTPTDTYAEEPGDGPTWRHFGIMVQRYSSQTLGFPNYTPARIENKDIHARWDPFEYPNLLDTRPWEDMWENRVDTLVFFCYRDPTPEMVRGLGWIINFMEKWMREYWERGHWVPMTIVFYFHQDPRFLALNDKRQKEVLNLDNDRKARSTAFNKTKEELICKLRKLHGYDDEIWFESGLWVVPENPCDWVWRHPAQQISLQE